MAGGGPNPQGSRYTHNDAAFVEYNTRLQSNNLPTFASAASKFTEWLSSDKAYYPNARVPVRLSYTLNLLLATPNPELAFRSSPLSRYADNTNSLPFLTTPSQSLHMPISAEFKEIHLFLSSWTRLYLALTLGINHTCRSSNKSGAT